MVLPEAPPDFAEKLHLPGAAECQWNKHSASIQSIWLYICNNSNSTGIFSRPFSLSKVAVETMCSSVTEEEAPLPLLGLQHRILCGCPAHLLQALFLTPSHHHAGPSHTLCGHLSCPALDPNPYDGSPPSRPYILFTCLSSSTHIGPSSQMDILFTHPLPSFAEPCPPPPLKALLTLIGSDFPLQWMPYSLSLRSDSLYQACPT